MGDETGMMMFMFMFIALAGGLYMFRDKLGGIFGGGGAEEMPPPEDMPPPEEGGEGGGPGAFTQDMLDCAKRCDSCDEVLDPETGQVFWHAARTRDEQRCFSCLKDKCRFLFPGDPEVIIKKITQVKHVPVPVPVHGGRHPKPKTPRAPTTPTTPMPKASYAFGRYY